LSFPSLCLETSSRLGDRASGAAPCGPCPAEAKSNAHARRYGRCRERKSANGVANLALERVSERDQLGAGLPRIPA